MKRALRVAGLALGVLALVAVATYAAGERTEVAVLRTWDEQGAPHATKLWVVDLDGTPWVRVANPQRVWFRRLAVSPRAELVRGGRTLHVVARPDASPETRQAIDGAFRAKYGAVDWWYGVLLRRDAIPVRLDPAGP